LISRKSKPTGTSSIRPTPQHSQGYAKITATVSQNFTQLTIGWLPPEGGCGVGVGKKGGKVGVWMGKVTGVGDRIGTTVGGTAG
jgi:hypothetical protein